MSFVKFGSNIPEFVKKFRDEMVMTQQELANLLGVSRDYVAKIEAGLATNPISFCRRVRPHLDKERMRYFDDILEQIQSDKLHEKLEVK